MGCWSETADSANSPASPGCSDCRDRPAPKGHGGRGTRWQGCVRRPLLLGRPPPPWTAGRARRPFSSWASVTITFAWDLPMPQDCCHTVGRVSIVLLARTWLCPCCWAPLQNLRCEKSTKVLSGLRGQQLSSARCTDTWTGPGSQLSAPQPLGAPFVQPHCLLWCARSTGLFLADPEWSGAELNLGAQAARHTPGEGAHHQPSVPAACA